MLVSDEKKQTQIFVGQRNNNNKKKKKESSVRLQRRNHKQRTMWNGHSRSLGVIDCCANWRGIYDFLLALTGDLICNFKRSSDTTPSLPSFTPDLSSSWNLKRRLGMG